MWSDETLYACIIITGVSSSRNRTKTVAETVAQTVVEAVVATVAET